MPIVDHEVWMDAGHISILDCAYVGHLLLPLQHDVLVIDDVHAWPSIDKVCQWMIGWWSLRRLSVDEDGDSNYSIHNSATSDCRRRAEAAHAIVIALQLSVTAAVRLAFVWLHPRIPLSTPSPSLQPTQ